MKVKVVTIELSGRQKRFGGLLVGLAAVAVGGSVAVADVPHTFESGQVLSSSELNENFGALVGDVTEIDTAINGLDESVTDVDARVTAIEAEPALAAIGANWWEFGLDDGTTGTGIDFHGGSTLTDFTARLYRLGGDNGDFIIDQRGGGYLVFQTNDVTRASIGADGHLNLHAALRVYDPGNNRRGDIFHTDDGNFHFDTHGGGGIFLNWFQGSGVNVGNGAGAHGPIAASSFNVASSRRFKEDIQAATYGLKEVLELEPSTYLYKKDPTRHREVGLIAESVQKVVPEVVSFDESGQPSGIDYSKLTVVLVGAIQEQQAEIEALQKNNREISARLDRLEKAVLAGTVTATK